MDELAVLLRSIAKSGNAFITRNLNKLVISVRVGRHRRTLLAEVVVVACYAFLHNAANWAYIAMVAEMGMNNIVNLKDMSVHWV